jgi:hypothetical protein
MRKERLTALGDYIGFAAAKLTGIMAVVIGGLASLDPAMLPIPAHNPERLLGIGTALLVGPKTVNLLAKVLNALKA